MAANAHEIGFVVLAAALVFGAVRMMATRNIVHAAYWLLAISLAAAGLFALLRAEYVALMQLLIYAGAVAILNIFTIMITLRQPQDAIRSRDFSWPALGLGLVFFGLVTFSVLADPITQAPTPDRFPDLVAFGRALFSLDGWVLPFEIASLVLTAALVAAVWWSKEDRS